MPSLSEVSPSVRLRRAVDDLPSRRLARAVEEAGVRRDLSAPPRALTLLPDGRGGLVVGPCPTEPGKGAR